MFNRLRRNVYRTILVRVAATITVLGAIMLAGAAPAGAMTTTHLPDLQVSAHFGFVSGKPALLYTVKNGGNAPAGAFNIVVASQFPLVQTQVNGLATGASISFVDVLPWGGCGAAVPFTVAANTGHQVTEWTYTNNVAKLTYFYGPC